MVVGGGEQRLADVEARKRLALENRHPPPALGEPDRGGAAGRAAAGDGDVEIVGGVGGFRGGHGVGLGSEAGQYTSHAFAMTLDPILRAFADTRARGARRADGALVVSPSRRWSADDLDRASRALAERLAGAGFGEGDALGLAAVPGPAFLAGYLALRRVGAVPVLCDSARPTPDRLAALDRLGVTGFLASAVGWPEAASEWDLDRRTPERRPAIDPAWGAVKLSPAPTGEPRGIATSAAALLADEAQLAETMGLGGDDRLLAAVPLSHSYGFSSLALPALVRGATLVLPEDGAGLAATASIAPLAPLAAARELAATVLPDRAGLARRLRAARLGAGLARVAAARPRRRSAARARDRGATSADRTGARCTFSTARASAAGSPTTARAERPSAARSGLRSRASRVAIDADSGRLAVRSAAVAERYLPDPAAELDGGRFLTGDLAALAPDTLNTRPRRRGRRGRADAARPRRRPGHRARQERQSARGRGGAPPAPRRRRGLRRRRRRTRWPAHRAACRGRRRGRRRRLRARRSPSAASGWPRTRCRAACAWSPPLPRTERGKLDRVALVALAVAES